MYYYWRCFLYSSSSSCLFLCVIHYPVVALGDSTPVNSPPLGSSGREQSTAAVKVKKTAGTAAIQEAKETTEAKKSVDNIDSVIDAIERMLYVTKEVSDLYISTMCVVWYNYSEFSDIVLHALGTVLGAGHC